MLAFSKTLIVILNSFQDSKRQRVVVKQVQHHKSLKKNISRRGAEDAETAKMSTLLCDLCGSLRLCANHLFSLREISVG